MPAKKATDHTQQLSQVRVAPLGELTAYTVHEHELDIIAAGSPATLVFNFAVALISIGISFILTLTLTTTTITSNRLYDLYVIVCVICLLAGIFMFSYWFRTRTSVDITVAKIKSRLEVALPIQEQLPVDPAGPPPA